MPPAPRDTRGILIRNIEKDYKDECDKLSASIKKFIQMQRDTLGEEARLRVSRNADGWLSADGDNTTIYQLDYGEYKMTEAQHEALGTARSEASRASLNFADALASVGQRGDFTRYSEPIINARIEAQQNAPGAAPLYEEQPARDKISKILQGEIVNQVKNDMYEKAIASVNQENEALVKDVRQHFAKEYQQLADMIKKAPKDTPQMGRLSMGDIIVTEADTPRKAPKELPKELPNTISKENRKQFTQKALQIGIEAENYLKEKKLPAGRIHRALIDLSQALHKETDVSLPFTAKDFRLPERELPAPAKDSQEFQKMPLGPGSGMITPNLPAGLKGELARKMGWNSGVV